MPRRWASNPFPDLRLLLETFALRRAEIAMRDDARDLALVQDGKMPEAAVLHHAQRLDGKIAVRRGAGIAGHHLPEPHPGGIAAFGQDTADGIAPGEDATQAAATVADQNGTEPTV